MTNAVLCYCERCGDEDRRVPGAACRNCGWTMKARRVAEEDDDE